MDYKRDDARFRPRLRPRMSSSNPIFSKPRSRTANSDFGITKSRIVIVSMLELTHQEQTNKPIAIERLKSTISNLRISLPKANSEMSGLGFDNSWRIVFFFLSLRVNNIRAFRGLMNGIFGILLGSSLISTRWCIDTKMSPQFNRFFFFYRRIYSLWYSAGLWTTRRLIFWNI